MNCGNAIEGLLNNGAIPNSCHYVGYYCETNTIIMLSSLIIDISNI